MHESGTVDWSQSAPPGFDLHTWESSWASLEEDAEDDPDAALSQFAELVERMLTTSGYALGDPVARQGVEPEIVATYTAARETADRAELGEATRSEVQQAIEDLRAVFLSFASAARSA